MAAERPRPRDPAALPADCRPQRFLRRVAEKSADHRTSGSVVIVAYGDSVTMGATAPNTLEPDLVYHRQLQRLLEARHPGCVFSTINSGIGGESATGALPRLERDVLRYQPDVVLVAFGLNDAFAGDAGLHGFEAALRTIVGAIACETNADAVLVTPPFLASRDNDAVDPNHRDMLPRCIALQTGGTLARYAEAIRAVARDAHLAVADVYAAWQRLAEEGTDTTAMLANGLNHPTGAAHAIAARCVMDAIDPA